ncbi:PucR family transcriptional regulator [Actinoallomurus rhizosphaericola]|uniref:PucR family transcriptional regulator n=1 Tax=Actinoallomurus rhizosphaericola TaxID=2952536 RepID=UPI0020902549|nr:PucR family transcriptional regulator [Actinoallomurus rhizosphaericola]MCO5992174.1 PucR family transcriptional regulator [Actinoallomurus rhizosphaericola]
MLPTLADVLRLDAVRRGEPRIIAGADHLDARVRWVHSAEVTDIAHLLRGGELVLTTGIALPDDPQRLRAYVAELAEVGASGLIVELGRKYARTLPDALVAAAEEHGLPLIAWARETPFVDVTEAVHARIIDAQLAELRASEKLHEVFTQLSVDGAPPAEVVRQVATLVARPVVLENLAHQVLAAELAGSDPAELLTGWETRSRSVRPEERTAYDESSRWLVTVVGARGEDWGRLIITSMDPPSPRDVVLIERAATTLALGRLLDRHAESLERQAHGSIISGILAHAYADPQEAAARARALGVPLTGRRLLGIVVLPRPPAPSGPPPALGLANGASAASLTDLAEATAAACREANLSALVGALDESSPQARVGVLASLPSRAVEDDVLCEVAQRLRAHHCGPAPAGRDRTAAGRAARARGGAEEFVMAVGSTVESVRDVRRSFLEAEQVADVAAGRNDGRLFYRLPDLRLRGLLHLLREDARLQTFTERELGPLLTYDAQRGSDLVHVLGVYLGSGRNKVLAAQRAHLSRPALYERLRRIERVLGADLEDVESCASLHVALLALDALRKDRA